MEVISWKNMPIFTEIFSFADKTKHNAIWSKALLMPLIIWNCVLS